MGRRGEVYHLTEPQHRHFERPLVYLATVPTYLGI